MSLVNDTEQAIKYRIEDILDPSSEARISESYPIAGIATELPLQNNDNAQVLFAVTEFEIDLAFEGDLSLLQNEKYPTQSAIDIRITDRSEFQLVYRLDVFKATESGICLLYTSPSPRDATLSRMPSSA